VDTTVQFIVQGAYRNFCPPFSISNDTIRLHVKEAYNPAPTITLDAGGLVKYNDTIAAVVNNTYCFRYRITDSLPRSNLARRVKVERADGSPIPASLPIWDPPYTQSDTVIEGQICWLATCAALGLVRIVVGVEDSLECRINHWRSDTIWFRVRELPNPPPFLAVSPPLLPQNADTFLLNAEQTVCFGFTIKDQQPMGRLKIAARAERISVEPVAAINLVLRNLKLVSDTILTGELCWQAPCRPLRATYRIVVELIDSNSCTLSHRLLDTLFVQVLPQPPGPIALVVNTYSLAFREDTVYLPVRTGGCFEVVLIDSFNDATLSLVPILDREVPFEISLYPENSRLRARFCWKPGCTFINEAVGVQVKGISKPRCSDSIVIVRRLLIRAYEPEGNRAPVIRRPVDNPVTLAAGVPACWGYVISDPDSVTRLFAQGRGALFEPPLKDAFQVRIEQTGDNPLSVTVCLTPTCEYRLDKYVLYLEAIDSTLCTRIESVTDTLSINIGDCGLQIPNVFTPNADGINDVFEPFFKQAIAGYEIIIYDRWGQLIRQLSNQGWNGQTQTNEKAPAGTYYYVLRYYLASQPETPLVIERTGYVDLVY
jgi:gliding motility-associated-like protein